MKKRIAGLVLCVLMLCCLYGCAQNEPTATQPTELLNETVPTTEATEPRELTEEGKTQLKYEQMFADGTYVMDWSCVTIDIGANVDNGEDYHVEVFSDENGVFWESLKPLKEDPCFYYLWMTSNFYRKDASTAYYYTSVWNEFTDNAESGCFFVDVDSENKSTVVTDTWNDTQSIFSKLIAQKNKVLYVGTEDGMDIIIINPDSTEPLFFYIDPVTCEVKKLYMRTLEKNYCIEFVDKTVDEITTFDNLPFTISRTISFADVQGHLNKMVNYLAVNRHVCHHEDGTFYYSLGVQLPIIEATETEGIIAEKQLKWEKVFAEKNYIMNWSSVIAKEWMSFNITDGYSFNVGRLTDENGVWWEHYHLDYNVGQSKYYRIDKNTAYFNSQSSETGCNWYLVDTSLPWPQNKVAERCEWIQYVIESWLSDDAYTDQLLYIKSVNGLDVIQFPSDGYISRPIELYINPDTYEVKYISFGWIDHKVEAELVYENRVYIHTQIPETTQGTIPCSDIVKYQDALLEEAANHGH